MENQSAPSRSYRAAVPHGTEHVAECLPLGYVEMNVARCDQRHARVMRERRELIELLLIVAAMMQFGKEIAAAREDVAVGEKGGRGRVATGCWLVRHGGY